MQNKKMLGKVASSQQRLIVALDAYDRIPKSTPESAKAWAAVMAVMRSEA